jgi:tetratricopeptide (TPR) repeat protein
MNPVPRRRRKLLWLVALAVVVAVGAAAAYRLRPTPSPPAIELSGLDPEVADAIRTTRRGVEEHPRSAAAWGRLGMVLFAHDLHAESLPCLEQAERLDPSDVRWPYYQGLILLLREPSAGLAPLRRAAGRGGRERAPCLRLAEALLAQDRPDEAEPLFRDVLETDPGHPRAELGLGQVAYRRGELRPSLAHLAAAATSPLARKAARATLAEVCERLGDSDRAEAERRQVAELPADRPWPDPLIQQVERLQTGLLNRLDTAATLFEQGRPDEAADLLGEVTRDHPESARGRLDLGRVLIRLGRLDEAEAELRAGLRLDPGAVNGHFLLGGVRVLRKDDVEAEACYRRVIGLKPTHFLAHYQLGQCRLRQSDEAGAAEAFRAALRARPNMTEAHVALAEVLLKQGRRDEARAHLEDALSLAPGHEKARQLLAK